MKTLPALIPALALLFSARVTLAGDINQPPIPMFERDGVRCGLIDGVWVPGVVLKNGAFRSHRAKLAELRKKIKKAEGTEKKRLLKKAAKLKARIDAESPICARGPDDGDESPDDQAMIHLVGYPLVEDFAELSRRGINTVLIELDSNGANWRTTYEAAVRYGLRLIPLIWDQDANQSIWRWDETREEWQLDRQRYPDSIGAAFLGFLKDHPQYLAQTFAIYSFHEPLWEPEKTGCSRLKTFYRQITENIFPGGKVRVYGEDITMGWEKSDECLTGVVDYENHLVYPFVNTPNGRYRPFNVVGNYYDPPTNDRRATIRAEIACLDERLRRYASSPPAATGRRPQVIVLFQTFVDREYNDLWNRMPLASEMEAFASAFLDQRKKQLKGVGWYSYRQAADNYLAWLYKDRFDELNVDRWEVLRRIGTKLK